MGAVQFIETLDRSSLTITDDEFEKNVEAAVAAIAEKHQAEEKLQYSKGEPEKPARTRGHSRTRSSVAGAVSSVPSGSTDGPIDERPATHPAADEYDEKSSSAGLFHTIQKPLNAIGRLLSDAQESASAAMPSSAASGSSAALAVPPPPPRKNRSSGESARSTQDSDILQAVDAAQKKERARMSAEDSAARQASAEAAEAQRIQRAEHENVVG
jgi:Rab5 GDP/GTP exchange factor